MVPLTTNSLVIDEFGQTSSKVLGLTEWPAFRKQSVWRSPNQILFQGDCSQSVKLTAEEAGVVASMQSAEMSRTITKSSDTVFSNNIPTNYDDSQTRAMPERYGPLRIFIAPKKSNVPMGYPCGSILTDAPQIGNNETEG